jgi:hypothetical protein
MQMTDGHAIPGFEKSIGDGERVVKRGMICKVAHGEVVDPADGAWVHLSGRIDSLDRDTAYEHKFNLMEDPPARVPMNQDSKNSFWLLPQACCKTNRDVASTK